MRRLAVRGALIASALIVFGACTSAATTAPTPAPTAAPATAAPATPAPATVAPATAAPATAAPASAAPAPIASVPAAELAIPGKFIVCSDIPYPPQEFFDAQGNPTGSDIDIGAEIAKRLGLSYEVQNSVFDTIIAAVLGGKCDVVISAQNITADRQKQVTMIPFFNAGQAFVVAKGNPKGINTLDDLCGKTIAAETGTTEVDYLNGTGEYKGQGLSAACVKKGKAAITVKEYVKDSDALLALVAGQVDSYFGDAPVTGYYVVQKPDQLELSPITPVNKALEGISVAPTKKDLSAAVKAALLSMIADGTYGQILKKYGVESGAVTAALVNAGK